MQWLGMGCSSLLLLSRLSGLSAATGGNWPSTFVLWLVDHVTFKHCDPTGEPCHTKDTEAVSAFVLFLMTHTRALVDVDRLGGRRR